MIFISLLSARDIDVRQVPSNFRSNRAVDAAVPKAMNVDLEMLGMELEQSFKALSRETNG